MQTNEPQLLYQMYTHVLYGFATTKNLAIPQCVLRPTSLIIFNIIWVKYIRSNGILIYKQIYYKEKHCLRFC